MDRERLRAFHEQSYRDSLDCWRSADRRSGLEMSEEEAAYSTLEHAELWLRDRESADIPDELRRFHPAESVRLVRTAYRFAEGFTLPKHFSDLLQRDALGPEDIEEVEQVLSQIDGLDAVVDLSARLADPSLESDPNLLSELTRMRCMVAKLVDQLSVRPDLVAVASRFLLVQRKPRYLSDGRPADWFTHLRELDREFGSPDLADVFPPNRPQEPSSHEEGQQAQKSALSVYCELAEENVGKFRAIKEYEPAWGGRLAAGTRSKATPYPEVGKDVPVVTLWPCRHLVEQAPGGWIRDAWGAYFNCRFFVLLTVVTKGGNRIGNLRIRSASAESGEEGVDCLRLKDVEVERENGLWGHLWVLEPPGESLEHQVFAVPVERAGQLATQPCILSLISDVGGAEEPTPSAESAYNEHPQVRALLGVLTGLQMKRARETSLVALVDQLAAHRYQPGSAVSQTFAFYAVWVAKARASREERLLGGDLAQKMREAFAANSSWPASFARYVVDLLV